MTPPFRRQPARPAERGDEAAGSHPSTTTSGSGRRPGAASTPGAGRAGGSPGAGSGSAAARPRIAPARPRIAAGLRRAAPGERRAATIVSLGDLVLDVVATMREPAAPGSDAAGTVRFRQGGSAANMARTVAHLGGRAAFVGAIGRDRWGRALVAALRAAGVTVHAVPTSHPTARIAVVVEPGGERSFVTERGAADRLAPDDVRPAWFRGAAVLHVPLYSLLADPLARASLHATRLARAEGAIVSVDLASVRPIEAHGRPAVWRRIAEADPSILFANEAEARALLGRRAEEALLELAPVVVIKEGARGCRLLAVPGHGPEGARVGTLGATALGGRSGRAAPTVNRATPVTLAVATRPLRVMDTTGAGDAFDAGFLVLWASRPDRLAWTAADLRRAATAGHGAAARHLTSHRPEIEE